MRRFNEKEVGALIQRATELHEESTGTSDRTLSLEEVERIAEDLGLSAEHVRHAALELRHRAEGPRRWSLFGGPFVEEQVRAVDGPLSDAQWERLVDEIREFTGSMGTVEQVGSAREWMRSRKDMGLVVESTRVSVRPEGDEATIRLRKSYSGAAFHAYLASLVVTVTAAGAGLDGSGLSDLASFAILSGSGIGGLALVRAALPVWARRQRDRLRSMGDRLQAALSSSETMRIGDAVSGSRSTQQPAALDPAGVSADERGGAVTINLPEDDAPVADVVPDVQRSRNRD